MPLLYVTGAAGSGKTAVTDELRRVGIDAYDEDGPGMGSAHNKRSGLPVSVPPPEQRSEQWFAEHEFRLVDGVLERLQRRGGDGLVVLCGNVFPPAKAVALFDQVLHLDVDEDTLRRRIETRVGNDYGQTPSEMQQILERRRALLIACREAGVVDVDATRPLAEVVERIVSAANHVAH